MSIAVSNNIDEKSISWNNESLLTKDVDWGVVSGSFVNGEYLELSAGAELHYNLDLNDRNIKANYLKLLNRVTCEDTTLSTDNVHNVSIIYEVYYLAESADGIVEKFDIYQHYPKYEFEDNFDKDYTIVRSRNSNISRIEITLINNEDIPVRFKNIRLFISVVLDEGTVNNVVQNVVKETVGEDLTKYIGCIPVLDADPDPSTVPNGINSKYILTWILSSSIS